MKLKRFVVAVFVFLGACASMAEAQDPKITAKWPVCRLGKAPIAPGPPPKDAVILQTEGPVIMSQLDKNTGNVEWIRCRLPKGTDSYRGTDGDLRDVASNQPYTPVGWDSAPPPAPEKGEKGDTGPQGPKGDTGQKGDPGTGVVVGKAPKEACPNGGAMIVDGGGNLAFVCNGKDGETKIVHVSPPVVARPRAFGIVVSGLVGRMSEPTSEFVSSLARVDVCSIEGIGFDLGIALKSGWRFTATIDTIDSGSSTVILCENCGTEIRTISQGMNLFGGRVEKVWSWTKWTWKPIFGVRAGAGILTGSVREEKGPIGGRPTSVKEVGPEEFLGTNILWNGGIGVGVAKKVGKFTLEPVLGVEYPRGPFLQGRVVYRLWE